VSVHPDCHVMIVCADSTKQQGLWQWIKQRATSLILTFHVI
jgi:hypothetical protein